MPKDRIVVWEVIPTLGGGGAEKMVLDLADGLKDSRYKVKIISLYDSTWATNGRLDFIKEHDLKVAFLNKKRGFDFNLLLKLISMIRNENPDIIHTHIESFQYILIARIFLKFNHIHTMHSIAGNEPCIYKKLLKYASKKRWTSFVVLSREIANSMNKIFGTHLEDIECIHNGVDIDYYCYKERTLNSDKINFITIGSLIPVKNQKLLIDAFAKFENIRGKVDTLTIVGDGMLKNDLLVQARDNNIEENVVFTGNVKDVRKYLYESDVFLLTSHYEGVSLALLEAASTGLPIIASNTGGTPELVRNSAMLFNDNDLQELLQDMMFFINTSNRKDYSNRARLLAENNGKKKMVDSYMNLYTKVIGR